MRFGHLAGEFERRNRLLSADGWETIEKLVEGVPSLQIIVERFQGHSRTHEDRCAAENFRVAVHDLGRVWHSRIPSLRVYAQAFLLGG